MVIFTKKIFFLLVFALLFIGSNTFAQTKTFDGSSNNNWGTAGNWTPSGIPSSTDNVIIPNGFTVNVNGNYACASLTINGGGTATGLTFTGTPARSLDVTGAVHILSGTGSGDDRTIAVGAGSLTCASVEIDDSGNANRDNIISVSTGSLEVSGDIELNGIDSRSTISITGAGTLRIGGDVTGVGDLALAATSKVELNGTVAQNAKFTTTGFANTYSTLIINNTSATGVTVNSAIAITTGTINSGRTLDIASGGTLSVSGSVANAGTFNVASGGSLAITTGAVTGAGSFTLNAGASLVTTNAAGLNSAGATGAVQTTTRSFSSGADYTFKGAATGTFTTTPAALTVRDLIINSSGTALSQNLTTTGALTLTAGAFNVGTRTLTLNGSAVKTSGSITSSASGTVNYNQSSDDQVVLSGTYGNLTFSDFNKTLQAATINIAGTFDGGAATGHTVTGNTINFNGANGQIIAAFGYYNLTSSNNNRTLQSSGIIGIANTFTTGTGAYTTTGSTVDFNGSGNQTVSALTTGNYNNLTTSNGGTKTIGSSRTVNGTVTIGAGSTLSLGTTTLTLPFASTPMVVEVGGVLSPGTSTVSFTGTANQTIPAATYYNLSSSNFARTLQSSGIIDIANTFTTGTGTYTTDGSTVRFSKGSAQTIPALDYFNLTSTNFARTLPATGVLGIAGAFTPGTGAYTTTGSTVDFNGTDDQTIPVFTSGNYVNITTSTGGIKTLGGNITTAGTVTVGTSTTLDLSTRTLTLTASGTPFVVDGTTVAGTSTVVFNGTTSTTIPAANYYNLTSSNNTRTLKSSGIIGIANTFTTGTGTYTTTGSTVDFNGAGNQTIPAFNSGNYNNLTTSNGGIKTIASNRTVNGTVTIESGSTLSLGSTTLTLPFAITPMVVNGTLDAGTSTVSFTGTSNQTIPAATYYNLTSSNFARTLQGSGIIDIDHTFTAGTGAYTTTNSTVSFSSASAQVVPVTSNLVYYNLSLTGAGTKTVTAPSAAIFRVNYKLDISAPVAYSNISSIYIFKEFNGNASINSGARPVTVGDDWFNTATGYTLTGDVTYTGEDGSLLTIGGINYTNLTITSVEGNTLTTVINNPITIAGTLTISDKATLNTNNNVTLLSTASTVANVAPLTGTANISGDLNVQLYFTGGAGMRGTRMVSPPVDDATMLASGRGIYQQLKEQMVITGPGGVTNGFDPGNASTPYAVTLTKYTESATAAQPQFSPVSTIALGSAPAATPGEGFFLFYRGDRTGYDPEVLPSPKLATDWAPESFSPVFTGPANQGNITVNLTRTNTGDATYDGYNVIGNPYPATIDWEKVYATNSANFANEIRVIQPGGAMMSRKNVDDVITVINESDALASRYIQPGQGFYIRKTTEGTSSFNFTESHKEISQAPGRLLTIPVQNTLLSSLKMGAGPALMTAVNTSAVQFYMNLKDAVNTDEAAIVFKDGFNANFDANDAPYLSGSTVILSSLSADGKPNAINYMPGLASIQEIKLNVNAAASGPLTLNFTSIAALGRFKVKLKDNYLNTVTDIITNPSYAFTIDRTVAASFGAARFVLQFDAPPALTINLATFTAVQTQAVVALNWVTANEESSVRFEIERSTDGVNYTKIGEKAGAGNSNVQTPYSFSDTNPAVGVNTYRLKQIYTDGGFSYSDPKSVTYTKPAVISLPKIGIKLYPNPADGILNIDVSSETPTKVVIYDLFGKTVKSGTFALNAQITFNITSLRTGIYFAEVREQNSNRLLGATIFLKR